MSITLWRQNGNMIFWVWRHNGAKTVDRIIPEFNKCLLNAVCDPCHPLPLFSKFPRCLMKQLCLTAFNETPRVLSQSLTLILSFGGLISIGDNQSILKGFFRYHLYFLRFYILSMYQSGLDLSIQPLLIVIKHT